MSLSENDILTMEMRNARDKGLCETDVNRLLVGLTEIKEAAYQEGYAEGFNDGAAQARWGEDMCS